MSNYNFENISYNDDLYYVRDTINNLVIGNQSSATNLWTGSFPSGISNYSTGLTIDYFLPYASNGDPVTLRLGNSLAKPVYLGNSSTQVTNEFPKNSVIRLTYIADISDLNNGNGAWKVSAYYNTMGDTVSAANGLYISAITPSRHITIEPKLRSTTTISGSDVYAVGLDEEEYLSVKVPNPTVIQDGLSGLTSTHYVYCETAADVSSKTATTIYGTPQYSYGLRLIVTFAETNIADNPTFNINGLGAKPIFYKGFQITTGGYTALLSGTIELVYDGVAWNYVGNNLASGIELIDWTTD